MLQLKKIKKIYQIGETKATALDDVSLAFRKSEFVCVLGHSGCGKTTLLNIIGGLDQYTSGDLLINGVSTKQYNDKDWDTYRNHSIGFVFQSYNLIPHQTVLANVELALTLSGVSKKERRLRATEVLKRVGLGDHLHKKPNQMSGGQMQRVAIARALVNDPDILLADEPTGALDSETSVQVMDILKEISKDKLIIMVTHNPDLAEKYATRTIRILDGHITNDSAPFSPEISQLTNTQGQADTVNNDSNHDIANQKAVSKPAKRSMRFTTALSLSLNNLMTKKGRTILTSFAGSIGIIGIALILSVSTGVQAYINRVQEDTLSSYPITINAEEVDLGSLITTLMQTTNENSETQHSNDAVYENQIIAELANAFNSADENQNDLVSFRQYIEENQNQFEQYSSAITYRYDFNKNIYTTDEEGNVVKSDINDLMSELNGTSSMDAVNQNNTMKSLSMNNMDIWEELLSGQNGEIVNDLLKDQYDVVWGDWPKAYNEIVLVVNEHNELSDLTLSALGLRSKEELIESYRAAQRGEQIDTSQVRQWSYDEIGEKTFEMILSADLYRQQSDGTYVNISETELGLESLYQDSSITIPLKVVGILRPNEDAAANMISGSIGYTSALTEEVIRRTQEHPLVQAQISDPTTDILTGMKFESPEDSQLSDEEKAARVTQYIQSLTVEQKAKWYTDLCTEPSDGEVEQYVNQMLANTDAEQLSEMLLKNFSEQIDMQTAQSYLSSMDEESKEKYAREFLTKEYTERYAQQEQETLQQLSTEELAAALDAMSLTTEQAAQLFSRTLSSSTYQENLEALGYVQQDAPDGINFYATSFENKDALADLIQEYNEKNADDESKQISYTDYVALLMSTITTIINAISYVLIAFVAISLIVSSIMIGIITYISVLERTKEIGILRAIGASKKDISRVFNAETLIVGFSSGVMGILVSLLILLPINAILHYFTGIASLSAQLPVGGAIILVLISMLMTLIAGLIPSSMAAKKDPVEALRTE